MSEIQVGQINSTDGSTAITTGADGYVSFAKTQIGGRRNLIINGSFAIDQRNGGASVTPANGAVTIDRWKAGAAQSSKFSIDQDAESPAGFNTSMKVTSLSAYTPSSNDHFFIEQEVEGYTAVPLELGSADAKDLSISFWVRSSLTGTFAGSLINSARDRSRVFEYTINSADTWEYKTVSFTGDTSGTWLKTNGKGVTLRFSFGAAGTWLQDAGSWSTGNVTASSGSVNLVATNGATLYITGVQLEVGTVATPHEHISYGEQLALCQRYFWRQSYSGSGAEGVAPGGAFNTNEFYTPIRFNTIMRAAPTCSVSDAGHFQVLTNNAARTPSSFSFSQTSTYSLTLLASATITLGHYGWLRFGTNSSAYIQADAEL